MPLPKSLLRGGTLHQVRLPGREGLEELPDPLAEEGLEKNQVLIPIEVTTNQELISDRSSPSLPGKGDKRG